MAGTGKSSDGIKAAGSVVDTGTEPPPLPLGWTQVRRARKRSRSADDGDGVDGKDMVWCCEDPNCTDRSALFANPSSVSASTGPVQKEGNTNDETNLPKGTVSLHGTAVLLLPDVDSSWFQGHFIPSTPEFGGGGKSKALGILATNRTDTDDCLKCAEGGYREMDLTLYSFGKTSEGRGRPRKIKFERAVCTGGDLVRLRAVGASLERAPNGTKSDASFDADRVLTGRRAAPYVRRYFSSVLKRLGCSGDGGDSSQKLGDGQAKDGNDEGLGEVLSDCAIVIGDMQLTVPSKFMFTAPPTSSAAGRPATIDDNDDWMSD